MRMRIFILIIVCFGIVGNGVTVIAETLQVSSTSSNGAWTSILQSGKSYMFEVSGTWIASVYNYNALGIGEGDAEWYQEGIPPYSPSDPWVEVMGAYSYSRDVGDLLIDNVSVDWLGSSDGVNWDPHVFSPNHVYRYYYTGTGNSVHLYISDHTPYGSAMYGDNSGSLLVSIQPAVVPEPISALLFVTGGALMAGRRYLKRKTCQN